MQRQLYDMVSAACSRGITQRYSTSFSLGIRLLAKQHRAPIYAIYGFVRLADEIVDTFHGDHQKEMFGEFRAATIESIRRGISVNPILHAFQDVVHQYKIDWATIDAFLESMETDLYRMEYNRVAFDKYIVGSAEVVGLMCLRVFTNGNQQVYEELKPYAMRLGAAFQKVNFLRDLRADYLDLGRQYFPNLKISEFSDHEKNQIELEIEQDFNAALEGIRKLPATSRLGVYIACLYYNALFSKIRQTPASSILASRIRVSNARKFWLTCYGTVRYNFGMLS